VNLDVLHALNMERTARRATVLVTDVASAQILKYLGACAWPARGRFLIIFVASTEADAGPDQLLGCDVIIIDQVARRAVSRWG
jgi:hypothetical protein